MKFFNTTVSRTTSFSIESFKIHKDDIISFFEKNTLFQLSILIASRDLYNDLKKNKTDKVKIALENYFKRAHFSPVPFGTFSKVGTLQWGAIKGIQKSSDTYITTTVDNYFFIKELLKTLKTDWVAHPYYTNPTIHFLSRNRLSYYKTKITDRGDFKTKYAELDFDENTEWIINQFKKGAKIHEISKLLIKDGFEINDIHKYLLEVIEAGLIINKNVLPPRNITKPIGKTHFKSQIIKEKTHKINSKKNRDLFINRIHKEQIKLPTTDTYKRVYTVTGYDKMTGNVHFDVQEKIKKYICFTLSQTTNKKTIPNKLSEFGKIFHRHFNDDFVPLSTVFNPKCGLEYGSRKTISSPKFPKTLLHKIIASNNYPVNLTIPKIDTDQLSESLSPTFGILYELLKCNKTGKEIIYFKTIGGVSAINILGRFTNATEELCSEIALYEEEIYNNQIVAEINMVSQARTLNVLAEKRYYKHVIPLNTAFDKGANPIFLEDLYVKYNGNRFILISKEKQKEIIPRLTSAINYTLDNSEIYQFLCDLQFQQKELSPIQFNFNFYENLGVLYVPRIYLEDDILLHPAQLLLVNNNLNLIDFKVYLFDLIDLYSFPNTICFPDKKGALILDLKEEETIIKLHKKLLEVSFFYISESIYSSFTPQIKENGAHYVHELYTSIKNTNFKAPKPLSKININDKEKNQNIPWLSDWLYLELYCNSYAENEILNIIFKTLVRKQTPVLELFFYVRYNNPKNHLRIRFKTVSPEFKAQIMEKIGELKQNNIVLEYLIKPYNQELDRYGGEKLMRLSEKIFHLDSLDTFNQIIKYDTLDHESIFLQAIFKIKYYFEFFSLTLDEMISQCELAIATLSQEFPLDKSLRKSFNKYSKNILLKINEKQYHRFLEIPALTSEITLHLQKSTYKKKQYVSDIIHMSMNRLFNDKPRFKEFQTYYITLNYLKQLKFTEKTINKND